MIHYILTKVTSNFDYFEKRTIVSYVNVYNYLELRKSPHLAKSIDKFTLDGILLVWCIRLLYGKKFKRLSPDFSSYFDIVFQLCEQQGKKLFFIGASQKEIENFTNTIQLRFPGIKIVGFSNGFLDSQKSIEVMENINNLTPDLVFIGQGTPRQEELAIRLKQNDFQGTIYTCGAFISQTSNHGFNYYPKIINSLHLRWLYRIIKEKDLMKRYFVLYPYSILLIIKDYLKKNK